MAEETREIRIMHGTQNLRLDTYLAGVFSEHSRTFLKKLIRRNAVLVNGNTVKPSYKTKLWDTIRINFPEVPEYNLKKSSLEVIYEDKSIVVINKPPGMNVHPAGKMPGPTPTVIDVLKSSRFDLKKNLTGADVIRPGIVHRLDRDTSGVMVMAKTPDAAKKISKQFEKRLVKKIYLAIVYGNFKEKSGEIESLIGRDTTNRKKFSIKSGRESRTDFRVLKKYNGYSLVEVKPKTGRTHQIRVHLAAVGHPVAGDKLYAEKEKGGVPMKIDAKRQMLHSQKIQFIHPDTGKLVNFTAALPKDFRNVLKKISTCGNKVAMYFFLAGLITFSLLTPTHCQESTVKPATARKTSPAAKPPHHGTRGNENSQGASEITKKQTQENKELKKLHSGISALKEEIEKLNKSLEDTKENVNLQEQRAKENNLAIADLNRKITEIEASLEKFKTDTKMAAIDEKDRGKAVGVLETDRQNQENFEKRVSEKVTNLESEISLLKVSLSQLQEKVGVNISSKSENEKNDEETEKTTLEKVKEIASSPWATVTAVAISILAIIIAVSR